MRLASSASSSSSSLASSSPNEQDSELPPMMKPGRRRIDKDSTRQKSGYPLQRGSACLSCRKRKMKCDASKPSCAQCIKAGRSGDCDYDDGKTKSRTQLLQDKISLLESRIRELEASPSFTMAEHTSLPAAVLYDHAIPDMPGSAVSFRLSGRSSVSLSNMASPSRTGSPWLSNPYDMKRDDLRWEMDSLSMATTPEDMLKASGRWWEATQPPPHVKQLMLDIFLPHRHQCGLEINVPRFQAAMTSPDPPHPALLNAIYALACHFSLSSFLTPHEPRFVARALRGITEALEGSESLVDVLRASCLLAVFFFMKGRLLEGYYHAGAAARLAVGLGLHQITGHPWITANVTPPSNFHSSEDLAHGASDMSILPPPMDAVELGERILAFWQVYNLDRSWSVATGLPVALSDNRHPRMRIETLWPRSLEDYETGNINDADCGMVDQLYSQVTTIPAFSVHDSTNALRAKAATLFEFSARLAASFGASGESADEQFWNDFQSVEAAIGRLSARLPPIRSGGRIEHTRFAVHVVLHAAILRLHAPLALQDAASQHKSAGVATVATAQIHELEDEDYQFLDPIVGTCWTGVAEALVRELLLRHTSYTLEQVGVLNRQLDVVVAAMNRLAVTVPLAAYQASKVEQSRGVTF